jgi:RNA polymerase sigma-70 factor (ECF subfamily)
MARDDKSQTSPTLLGRLRQNPIDQAAWEAFVDRYGPKIQAWCRHWNLQEADAHDVMQDVMLKLARKISTFEYDPTKSFRAWLRTLTHHAWSDFVDDRRRARVNQSLPADAGQWETTRAGEDLVQRLDGLFEQEQLEEAMARVRLRVKPHTWQAFHLQALDGLSGAETSKKLEMTATAVFVARSRVQRMLQEEMEKLEGAGTPTG